VNVKKNRSEGCGFRYIKARQFFSNHHLSGSLSSIKTQSAKPAKMYKVCYFLRFDRLYWVTFYLQIFVCALLAAANAAPAGEATSYTSFNQNHNAVQHIQSAAPVAHQYSAPTVYATPAIAKVAIPAAPSYYHASAPSPVVTKVAIPVISKQVIAAPVAKLAPAYAHRYEEEYPAGPAKYEFAYSVADPHTGDYHSQEEKRDGDHVVGQYSLHEADGTVRIVRYSDEGHGFNAVVERQGHPTEAPVAYKKLVAVAPQYSAPHYPSHY